MRNIEVAFYRFVTPRAIDGDSESEHWAGGGTAAVPSPPNQGQSAVDRAIDKANVMIKIKIHIRLLGVALAKRQSPLGEGAYGPDLRRITASKEQQSMKNCRPLRVIPTKMPRSDKRLVRTRGLGHLGAAGREATRDEYV
jgi:hypothetical protein